MALNKDQVSLFLQLVDAARRVPRARQQFTLYYRTDGEPDRIVGAGLPASGIEVLGDDITELEQLDLVQVGYYNYVEQRKDFTITTKGLKAAQVAQAELGAGTKREEAEIRRYLGADGFRTRYVGAYEKWLDAEQLLWSTANTRAELTTIGHKTREAIQRFATALAERHGVATAAGVDKTVDKIRDVLGLYKGALSARNADLLDRWSTTGVAVVM